MLLDALSAAADEITRDLAPGSVELRLRAGEPEFVVTPVRRRAGKRPLSRRATTLRQRRRSDEGATARINLRLPEQLKAGVEQAAGRERLSVNAWLVRVAAAARRAATTATAAAWRPHRPGLHRLGALIACPSASDQSIPTLTRQEATVMPTFETPNRSRRTIDVAIGDVRISAGDRGATVVEVRPQRRVQRARTSGPPS